MIRRSVTAVWIVADSLPLPVCAVSNGRDYFIGSFLRGVEPTDPSSLFIILNEIPLYWTKQEEIYFGELVKQPLGIFIQILKVSPEGGLESIQRAPIRLTLTKVQYPSVLLSQAGACYRQPWHIFAGGYSDISVDILDWYDIFFHFKPK